MTSREATPATAALATGVGNIEQLGKRLDRSDNTAIPDAQRKLMRGCRECGNAFTARRAGREFCSAKCRTDFHNRRARRGAELYDVLMNMRFDRANAEDSGAWFLLCRMAANFKAEDDRERAAGGGPGTKLERSSCATRVTSRP